MLRDLIPMNFFNEVVIMKLEMCTTGKIFGKTCLKAIRDTFLLICDLQSREERDEV